MLENKTSLQVGLTNKSHKSKTAILKTHAKAKY